MILPGQRPRFTREDAEKILKAHGVSLSNEPLALIGIRGYYLNSMGEINTNDRGIYDDAAAWITETGFITFNFNTDPSRFRAGEGFGDAKGMATLIPGVWYYERGIHKDYYAFTQAAKVMVSRDGYLQDYCEAGWFGINIHRGGYSTTSSLGCQTVPPDQWQTFRDFGFNELRRYATRRFPYILINEEDRRKL